MSHPLTSLQNKNKDTISWKDILSSQKEMDYYVQLKRFLDRERNDFVVYPSEENVFRAFKMCRLEDIKVVIIGQDPYHGRGQANGLSFSVNSGVALPPSLFNIFREIKEDVGVDCKSGNLDIWANQGVFLLNSILTVREKTPLSHQNKGWEIFTDYVINEISNVRDGLIFLLWGKYAQSKEYLIDSKKHFIFKSTHPSPYSANSGFFGCKHFSKANKILEDLGKKQIDWST